MVKVRVIIEVRVRVRVKVVVKVSGLRAGWTSESMRAPLIIGLLDQHPMALASYHGSKHVRGMFLGLAGCAASPKGNAPTRGSAT